MEWYLIWALCIGSGLVYMVFTLWALCSVSMCLPWGEVVIWYCYECALFIAFVFVIAFQVAGVKVAIFIIQIVLSAVGIIVNLVWLQLCYICYHLVGLRMCFIVGAINYHTCVLFIAYSGCWCEGVHCYWSDGIISCWSQHCILCSCSCLTSSIIWWVHTCVFYYCYCYHQCVLFIAFQVAGVWFILIILMTLSAVVISVGSYEIRVVLYTSSII